mgnify:FL=1
MPGMRQDIWVAHRTLKQAKTVLVGKGRQDGYLLRLDRDLKGRKFPAGTFMVGKPRGSVDLDDLT